MIVDIGRVAHGGVCVAHAPDGRVVFVRHALPGEQVRVVVTEDRKSYLRADAVDVMRASPHRRTPPCPWAGPGRCGGCDWQHVTLDEQRRMKAAIVSEQLHRLGGFDVEVMVEPVAGDTEGLGWRTRLRLAVDDDGVAGLRRHRSHVVEHIGACLIAHPAADVPEVVARQWPPGAEVTVDVSGTGERAVAIGTPGDLLTEHAVGRDWAVPVGGFWQVHPGAADALVSAVLEMAAPLPSDSCLDLYSGVGLFAGALADRVARVTAVESDPRAVAAARRNLRPGDGKADVRVVRARVDQWIRGGPAGEAPGADVVVLDPPRKGAGRDVVTAIVGRAPRVAVYVACDPSALARDVATFARLGYGLTALRAFDIFPMTAHVECVARLEPFRTSGGERADGET